MGHFISIQKASRIKPRGQNQPKEEPQRSFLPHKGTSSLQELPNCLKLWNSLTVISIHPQESLNWVVVVQSPSRVLTFATPWTAACRLLCPSPSPRVCLSSCPVNQWCYPTISLPVDLFSSCLQSFPEKGSFLMSQLFPPGGQSTGASVSASALPKSIPGWFPLRLTGLISLQSKELSSLLQHHSSKASIRQHSAFFIVQLSHPYMTNRKTIALTIWLPDICNLKFKVIKTSGTPRAVEMQTVSGRS